MSQEWRPVFEEPRTRVDFEEIVALDDRAMRRWRLNRGPVASAGVAGAPRAVCPSMAGIGASTA